MISTVEPFVLADDLRFALETMEERTHLGLSTTEAKVLRARILKRLNSIENSQPAQLEDFPVSELPE